ncbi:MAG: metal ABC transporter ATP-binding protein [Bacteroidales bacterium]
MNKQIIIQNLNAGYHNKTVLNKVNLTINKGDFLGIIGPNGGGKTTLLKVILGLLKPMSGEVSFYRNNEQVEHLQIGYLPQHNQVDKEFPINVRELIQSGLTPKNRFLFSLSKEQKESVSDIIKLVGLSDFSESPLGELSGGQLQRALLGRAIISKPEVLVLDEPNSYLDRDFEVKLYDLLQEINKNSTIILVSHNISTVRSIARSLACVNRNLHYHPTNNITESCIYDSFLQ